LRLLLSLLLGLVLTLILLSFLLIDMVLLLMLRLWLLLRSLLLVRLTLILFFVLLLLLLLTLVLLRFLVLGLLGVAKGRCRESRGQNGNWNNESNSFHGCYLSADFNQSLPLEIACDSDGVERRLKNWSGL
jgi:hypothetical protein